MNEITEFEITEAEDDENFELPTAVVVAAFVGVCGAGFWLGKKFGEAVSNRMWNEAVELNVVVAKDEEEKTIDQ